MTAQITIPTMGTIASLTSREPVPAPLADALRELLDGWEGTFSLHRMSALTEVNAGRLPLSEAPERLQRTLAEAESWDLLTGGAFTPYRPGRGIDLYGIVKALAMGDAAQLLVPLGSWILNVGGDVLTAGSGSEGPWRLGIVDPADRGRLLSRVACAGGIRALATSGTAERGEHIRRRPETSGLGRPDARFVQVSVAAEDIVTADVLATAIMAGGRAMLDEATRHWPIEVLAVDARGALLATGAFRAASALA